MNHAPEGVLQAYLDGETAAEVEVHLAGCADCRSELDRLRARSELVSQVLRQLESSAGEAVTTEQAWWRVQTAVRRPAAAAGGRFALGALARAAVILLVLAGALAAIPGSPLRKLAHRLLVESPAPAATTETPATPAPVPPAEATPVAPDRGRMPGVVMAPSAGRINVLMWSAQPGATISVELTDGDKVTVEAGSDVADVHFRTMNGQIEVMNLGSAQAIVEIPRSLPYASLTVDGRQWLLKEGDQLRLDGPVVERAGDGVIFRAN